MKVSVIGLGKLGACLAAWISSKGHEVVGVDVNPTVVQKVSDGNAPVEEPGLQEMMYKHPFQATTDTQQAVLDSQMTFVIVPTPSLPDGAFDLKYVHAAAQHIGLALKRKDDWHLVVITSTVMPGHMDQVAGTIEQLSGKVCGEDFGLCYNPLFIALGSVLFDMENPDLILIGESDERAGSELAGRYSIWLYPDPQVPTCRMNFINAEIAKLALNCYVTMKISFANMIGELAERVPGGDADAILTAIGHDQRIGSKCLRAGVGYGGPCFPRDNKALRSWATKGQADRGWPYLAHATDQTNRDQLMRYIHMVEKWLLPDEKVGILGIAYKSGTGVTEQSQGAKLAHIFQAMTYDPLAPCTNTLAEVLTEASVIVVMLPLKEFTHLNTNARVVIDPWRCVKTVAWPTKLIQLGRYRE